MRIVIQRERPIGWNQFYSGMHWTKRKAEVDRVHWLVRGYIKREYRMFEKKVDIKITAYFKNRPLDSDNINAKLYIDGLKGRIIKDDKPEYVGAVTTESKVDKTNPRLEIEIL